MAPLGAVCSSSCTAAVGGQGAPAGVKGAAPKRGRRVALKRFYDKGTMMFQSELRALLAVGTHPNILRLFESFGGPGSEDDILVLEYCDGGDVYELYAKNGGCCILESFVAQLIRQLLQALLHLASCRVEHRDVKPENLLIYGAATEHIQVPQLKLADFGWASVLPEGSVRPRTPPEGVGSLWYAPPELNPPVKDTDPWMFDDPECHIGSCDMWGVGVIAYLLLVGHSPFSLALNFKEPGVREAAVIRLAAAGEVNTNVRVWATLSKEARAFVLALIQPCAGKRLSAAQAWAHPWMTRWKEERGASLGGPAPALPGDIGKGGKWRLLGGFQQLCWLAFARAVGEPELAEDTVLQNFINGRRGATGPYVEHLAQELVCRATPFWFTPDSAWVDALRLGFSYLDVDADGFLSVGDLAMHLDGDEVASSAETWVRTWRQAGDSRSPGLTFADYQWALQTSQQAISENAAAVFGQVQVLPAVDRGEDKSNLVADAVFQRRMRAVDDFCQRFLDEEFDRHGFGL